MALRRIKRIDKDIHFEAVEEWHHVFNLLALDEKELGAHKYTTIAVNMYTDLPSNWHAVIYSDSELLMDKGISVGNTIILGGEKGIVMVTLINHSDMHYVIEKESPVAKLIIFANDKPKLYKRKSTCNIL